MESYVFSTYFKKIPKQKSLFVISGSNNNAGDEIRLGNGSISGKVLENGLPVSRRVMLYVRGTGAYVGQVRSDADGSYTFKNTDENLLYFVVSIDDSNNGVQYNLVGQDLISGNHDKRVAT